MKLLPDINPRQILQTLKEIVTQRLWLKLLSIVIALLLWTYIVQANPSLTRSKYVKGVNVSVSGSSVLSNYGLASATDIFSDYLGKIAVTLEVSQSQFSKATNKNIVVLMDISGIRSPGEHEITLTATSVYGTVTRIYPETLTVNIESLDSRQVPIEAKLIGRRAEGLWYDFNMDSMSINDITVSGAASVVQRVESVQALIDVTGITAPFQRAVMLTMLDASGNTLPSALLSKSASTCSVQVNVYPCKELELTVDASQIRLLDGYVIDQITFQPATVTVAAEQTLLDDLEYLPLELPADMEILGKSNSIKVAISGLSEFKHVSSNETYMSVTVSEIRETNMLEGVRVQTIGLMDGLTASLAQESISVQVSGARSLVNALSGADIYAYVDLKDMGEGTYDVPVYIGNKPEFTFDALTPPTIKVTVARDARTEE